MDRTSTRENRSLVPFGEANRMIENAWSAPRPWPVQDAFSAMDMYETEEGIVIEVLLPGVDPKDVEVRVMGDTLTLRGELKRPDPQNAAYILQERSFGTFQRTIQLPGVKSDKVDATLEKGILRLVLAKPEEERARRIKIKAIK